MKWGNRCVSSRVLLTCIVTRLEKTCGGMHLEDENLAKSMARMLILSVIQLTTIMFHTCFAASARAVIWPPLYILN
jgi:hypothetical protein